MGKLLLPFVVLFSAVVVAMLLDRPMPRADIVVAQVSDCLTLDPQRMSYMQDLRMARSLYEPLVKVDSYTGRIIPGTASSWEQSDDGRTWTFHLRADARWSNGDPVTADDYVYSWRRAMLPDTAVPYSNFFFDIEGAKAFWEWRNQKTSAYVEGDEQSPEAARALLEETWRRFDETVSLKATDERTLVVSLEKPVAYFLEICAFSVLAPVHPPTVEPWVRLNPTTGRLEQRQNWTKPELHVGNGPYKLVRWRYKRDLRLERNPEYWDQSLAKADTIEIICIQDPNTMTLAFESGTIDWVSDVRAEYRADLALETNRYLDRHAERLGELLEEGLDTDAAIARLPIPKEGERRNVHVIPSFGTFYFSINCREKLADGRPNPLADAGVRRALTMAIDKQSIIDNVFRTDEKVARTLTPPDSINGYETHPGLDFDPERARAELIGAGWRRSDDDESLVKESGEVFPPIEILFTAGEPRYNSMALAMRDMWKKHLGLEVVLKPKEPRGFDDDLDSGNFMIARGGWYGDYGDPTTFLDLSLSKAGNNIRKYKNPEFDQMLEDASRESDPARRMRMLAEAERFLMTEALPMIPMYHYTTTYMFDPTRIRGLSRHTRLQQNLWLLEPISSN